MKTQARAGQALIISPAPRTVARTVIRHETEFLALERDWTRITAQMACKTPCFEWAYIVSWWRTFAANCPVANRPGQLYVVVVREGEEVIGIVPLFYTKHRKISPFPRRLRLIGYSSRLEPYDMTEEPLIALLPGMESVVLEQAAAEIQAALQSGECDCCVIRWLDTAPAPVAPLVVARFKRKEGSGYVHLPESWQAFRKSLSKSMRDNLPYYGRLLVRHGHSWHVEIADIGPEWDHGVNELIRLHRLRTWLSNDPTRRDHLPTPAHREFLDTVHNAFRGDTRAFIGLLVVDGKVVASQSYLDDSKTLMLSYSGHNPAWSKYSPLLVLQAEIIKQAIERGTRRLDFLYGMAPWQERWQPTRDHPTNKLALVAKRPSAIAKCLYYMALREFATLWDRSFVKRSIQRNRVLANDR